MKAGWHRRAVKRVGWSVALLGGAYVLLLGWVWAERFEFSVYSEALKEHRRITVFGRRSVQKPSVIYALDGDKYRHALLPAAHAVVIATLYGRQAPLFVAVHDHGQRDIDFRPAKVQPAYWRPDISGRSPLFDRFLIEELRSAIEKRFGPPGRRYLFGHSLGGYYAVDMATRQSRHGFSGLFAFSPTFSHDVSVLTRLDRACANTPYIYASIGLESGRDSAMFNRAESSVRTKAICAGRISMARHPGMLHQLIMLSGQLSALRKICRDETKRLYKGQDIKG